MASKRFSLTFDVNANIGPVKSAIQQFQNLLKNTTLNIPISIKSDIEGTITKLSKEIEKFESKAGGGFSTLAEVREMEKSFGRISTLMQRLKTQSSQISGLKPESFLTEKDLANIKTYQESLKTLSKLKEQQLQEDRKSQKEEEKLLERRAKVSKKLNDLQKEDLNDPKKGSAKRAKEELEKEGKTLEQKRKEFEAARQKVEEGKKTRTKSGRVTDTELKEWLKGTRYEGNIAQYRRERDAFKEIDKEASALKELSQIDKDLQTLRATRETSLADYQANLEKLRKSLAQVKGVGIGQIPIDLKALESVIKDLNEEQLAKFSTALKQFGIEASNIDEPMINAAQGIENFGKQAEQASRAAEDMSRLKNQLYDFFSISNTIQIFKNTVRDSFNTIKELDAVMTETAVVTDFTVGDMWEKLPEYASQATKLGSSIKSLYEATTLYYQQGLNSEQAMSVGSETMKMARIANMDAADATEAMTAALRGFNMEIDQTSATRVNDVYSELAAITAADTSQIATAMTKTASIAASANMEFETTAAFLAQIIETTQEAPETAGTAMKTIIARFTEVKELFDKGMLTGEDEEGEAIEINKIDAALKSVGISLRDFLLGSKGIDDIFLELASKWDSLDLATQRYIATTAAGSRQQSRFIAMMSDYERTMELVTAANNSAGAGQKQFDKTLESLDSKLQRLSNAWQQFTMNLANSTLIKGGIDLLSNLLETVNKIIDAVSGGNGLVASFVTLAGVLSALKIGDSVLTQGFRGIATRAGIQVGDKDVPVIRKPFQFQAPTEQTFGYGALSWLGQRMNQFIAPSDRQTSQPIQYSSGITQTPQIKHSKQIKSREEAPLNQKAQISTTWNSLEAKPGDFVDAFLEAETEEELIKFSKEHDQALKKPSSSKVNKEDSYSKNDYLKILTPEEREAQRMRGYQKASIIGDGLTLAGGITNIAAAWANEKGYEDLSKGLVTVGTTAQIAGQGLGYVNQALFLSGKTWPQLGAAVASFGETLIGLAPVALPVIAGLTTAAVALQVAWKASPEGQLAEAVKRTEQTAEGAKNASDSYNNLQASLKNIENQASAIENMTRNTQEWNNAVNQMNKDTADLISKNEELAGAASYEDGILKLDKSKVNEYMRQEELDVIQAKNAELNARILEEQARQKTYDSYDFLTGQEGVYDKLGSQRVEDLTKQLAQAVADGKVFDQVTVEEWTNQLKNSFGKNFEVKLDEDSLNTLREYGNALNESGLKVDNYEAQMANNIKTMAKTEGALTDFTSNLDDSIVSGIRDQAYQQKYDEILKTFNGKDFGKRLEEYAALMGYTLDGTARRGSSSYSFIDKQGNKQTVDYISIIQALASEQADEAAVENLSKVEEVFGQNAKAAEILSQDGISMTNESVAQLGQVFGENVQADESARKELLAQQFRYGSYSEMAAVAESKGLDMDELYNTMADNYESAVDRINKQRTNLVANMSKYTGSEMQQSTNMLANLEYRFGDQGRNMLESVFDSLMRSGDDSIVGVGFDDFIATALTSSKEEAQDLANFISEIDWSNPIQAASALKTELNGSNEVTKQFSSNMLAVKTGFLGAASQMRYMIESSDFTDMQEDLTEILETSEKITASDVLDLADSYQNLNKMLKNTESSAGGVAKALDAITKKQIKVEDLTDAVLASLQGYDSLGSMIAELGHELANFDAGVDENMATEFVAQAHEALAANLKKGAVGNSQNFKYLDYLFGDSWRTDTDGNALDSKQIAQNMQTYSQILSLNSQNMENLWSNLAKDRDISGRRKLTGSELTARQEGLGGLSVTEKNGEILLSGYEGMTTKDIVSRIAAGYGISENLAAMMVADYKNYSHDFDFNMKTQEADASQIAANTLKGLGQFGDAVAIDQSSINTISSIWGIGADIFQKALTQAATDAGKTLLTTSFYDENGNIKNSEDVLSEMNKATGKSGYFDDNTFKYDEFMRDTEALGLSKAQSDQVAQDLIDAQIEASKEPVELEFDADKGIKKVSVETGEKVSEEVSAGYEQAANESLASTFFDYFSNNPLPVQIIPEVEGGEIVTEGTAVLSGDTTQVADAVAGLDLSAVVKLIPSINFTNFGFFAKGVTNAPVSQPALVGEKGPELIEKADGTAYLSGINGPEITHIGVGDTVHTAEETSRIFRKNKGYTMPRFEGGTTSHGYGKTSGGKAGSADEVENPFDKLYNLVREIDEELRQRERIERRYEKLLESLNESANQIIQVSREELAQLEYERKLQEKLVEGRKEQIKLYQQERKNMTKYGWTEENDRGETVLRIDWDKIDAVSDKKEMGEIQKYVSQLEEWFDSLREAEDALWDIEDAVEEIKDRGQEEYDDLEKAISEALTKAYQDEIDKLGEINDSINETNSSLMESIQKSIDKMRQDRENERTEEELGEKQRRLMYLQQDTSGANELEILKLQEELSQGQEDYTDSLIDQKISELQDQNDEAAKQREQQITLLQAQLDHYIESGEIWQEVYALMDNGLDKDTGLLRGTRLEEILKNEANFAGLSAIGQMTWWTDMNGMIAQALAYLEVGRQLEDIGVKAGSQVEFKTESGEIIKGTVDKSGNVVGANGYIYDNVFQGADGKYYAGKNIKSQEELKPKVEKPKTESVKEDTSNKQGSGYNYQDMRGKWHKSAEARDAANKKYIDDYSKEKEKFENDYKKGMGGWDENYYNAQKAIIDAKYSQEIVKAAEDAAQKAAAEAEKARQEAAAAAARQKAAEIAWQAYIKNNGLGLGRGASPGTKFATGGLADFTGPAWLDGTKARPELVLNARDTQNFIQLKDILGSIMNRGSFSNTSTENNGDITYDIDINVESVDNDYDVEKIAKKVKTLINDNARYRNNNTVSLRR